MAAATPDEDHDVGGTDEGGAADVERPATPPRSGPGVLAAVAGALCLVYVVWYIVDLVTLSIDPSLFNAAHEAADNIGMRLLFSVLFLAIAYHTLDGLRRTLIDFRPSWATHDAGLRGAVAFLTMAAAVPVTLLVLWPSVRTWAS